MLTSFVNDMLESQEVRRIAQRNTHISHIPMFAPSALDISDWDRCGSVNIIEQETLSNQTEPRSISEFTTVSKQKNMQAYHEVNSSAEGGKLLANGFVVLRVPMSLWFARGNQKKSLAQAGSHGQSDSGDLPGDGGQGGGSEGTQ